MGGNRSTQWDQYTVTESGLYLTDNTIADVSSTRHGFTPKHPGDTTKYFRGDGTWATLTGGTGLVPDWATYDPFSPPTGYNATVTDTFPGNSLDAKWTKTGAITLATSVQGGLHMTGGTSGTFQVGLIEQTAPGTPYILTAPFQMASLATLNIVGLHVRESSGGKFWAVNQYRNSAAWTDTRAVVSRYASTTSRTSLANDGAIGWPGWLWLRLENDGTNLKASYSVEGRFWTQFFTETIAASNLNGTTIDKVGLMYDNFGTTAGHTIVRAFHVT